MRYNIIMDLMEVGGRTLDELGVESAEVQLSMEGTDIDDVLDRAAAVMAVLDAVVVTRGFVAEPSGEQPDKT